MEREEVGNEERRAADASSREEWRGGNQGVCWGERIGREKIYSEWQFCNLNLIHLEHDYKFK